jgi:hypothetical protein
VVIFGVFPPRVLVLVLVLVLDEKFVDLKQPHGLADEVALIPVETMVPLVSAFRSTKTKTRSRSTTPVLESWPKDPCVFPPRVLVLVLVLVLDERTVDLRQPHGLADEVALIPVETMVPLMSAFRSTKTKTRSRSTTPVLEPWPKNPRVFPPRVLVLVLVLVLDEKFVDLKQPAHGLS